MSSNEEAKKPGTPRSRERSRSPVRGSGRDPVSDVAMLPDPDPELARQLVAEQLGVRIAKLIIQVPPDGRCLYHCFTAWQFGPAWLRHRDAAGFSSETDPHEAYLTFVNVAPTPQVLMLQCVAAVFYCLVHIIHNVVFLTHKGDAPTAIVSGCLYFRVVGRNWVFDV
jgi:hypothetical protein